MPKVKLKFVGGPYDGAGGDMEIEGEPTVDEGVFQLGDHDYTINFETGVATFTPDADPALKRAAMNQTQSTREILENL